MTVSAIYKSQQKESSHFIIHSPTYSSTCLSQASPTFFHTTTLCFEAFTVIRVLNMHIPSKQLVLFLFLATIGYVATAHTPLIVGGGNNKDSFSASRCKHLDVRCTIEYLSPA